MGLTDRILELLYDRREGFFGLPELAESVGVEVGRLDAHLKALGSRGQKLEFSPASGVRLCRPAGLDSRLIERDLATRRLGRGVLCFEEVDSTNDVAFDAALGGGADGLVVLAEYQRLGRGRQGRKWLSPARANILLSALLIDRRGQLSPEALTIAAGLSVAEAIEDVCGLVCQLKWPNDVLLEGAKVAGGLVEMRTVTAERATVVGIGVNANAAPAPGEVEAPATHLAEHLGDDVERIDVIRAVLRRLDGWVDAIARRSFRPLHEAWLGRCGMINQRLAVLHGTDRYVGRVMDVSPLEGLVLVLDDGSSVRLPAAGSIVEPAGS